METKQFAPGVAEAFAAQGADVADLIPAAAPATFTATFLPGKDRSQAIPLDWPIQVGATVYTAIVLKRMTAGEVAAFMASIKDSPEDAKVIFPVFRDADDREVPKQVLDALDDDDMMRLNEAAMAFLPRRFGGDPASASIPASGEATAP